MGLVYMPTDVEWRKESLLWVESRHTKQMNGVMKELNDKKRREREKPFHILITYLRSSLQDER